MEKTNKKGLFLGLIIIIAVVLAVLFAGKSEKIAGEPIKIGVVLPLSGGAADYGQSSKKAIDLAVEKVLNNDGLKLDIIYEDSQADPKLAVTAVQKLINIDKVKYVVGFSSGEILAMCPITEANKVVLITPASSPDVTTKCGDYTFRNLPADTYQGKVLADKVSEKGYKKVAVFYINNDYGVGLKDEFVKDFKGTITDIESHKPKDTDFRTQLAKIKASVPEAIVLISQMPEGPIILRQRGELNLDQPVFSSEALKDPSLLKMGDKLLANLYISFVGQYDGQEFQNFSGGYQQKYGSTFGAFSDYEYDNVLTLANAINICKGGEDVVCVKSEIYKTNIVGATGLINFDSNGDRVNKDYVLYKVEDNNFVPVE